jgi:hypothetical protein
MSIKNSYRFKTLVTAKLSKERFIFLVMVGSLFQIARKHDLRRYGPLSN